MIEATQNPTLASAPGEYAHYYINLLALFGNTRPIAEIETAAAAAVALRSHAMSDFSNRLAELRAAFEEQGGERAQSCPPPRLRGLERVSVEGLKGVHQGALVALFHYGPHRDILCDLACAGVPFIAPVAKRAYFECNELATVAPESFEQAMDLIEVEDPRVGLKLLRGLKRGRLGLIYVDGNMGPDGHRVQEGAVPVDFLGMPIRVKAGIARLARSLQLPIIPVMASHRQGGQVRIGQPLAAPASDADAALVDIMQRLYDELATEVVAEPGAWEFAFCLHRWRTPASPRAVATHDEAAPLTLSPQRVALLERNDGVYWVDVQAQKAYRVPDFARGLYQRLIQPSPPSAFAISQWLSRQGATATAVQQLLHELRGLGLFRLPETECPGAARA